jgi:uncharacterized protein YlxW (UPF0749 family)
VADSEEVPTVTDPVPGRRSGTARIVGRFATCMVFALAGFLFYTSGRAAHGTSLRNDDTLLRLSDVIQQRSQENASAENAVAALRAQVDSLAAQHAPNPADAAHLGALEQAVGLDPLDGGGVTVTLNDAPPGATAKVPGVPQPQPDDLVVHQQDLQAVVNALWRGGATGLQIQDQRLISTSAVRCVGNQLILQGRVYSPPYVIRAVGDPAGLAASVGRDTAVQTYLQYVAAYGLGWKLDRSAAMALPAYAGTVDLQYAKVRQ